MQWPHLGNGPASAATLAAGLGCAALGFLSTLSEVNQYVAGVLNFYNPSGNLSGKTLLTIVIWLLSWSLLHKHFAGREVAFDRILNLSLLLVGLGFLGTFPPFFGLLAG
ncbi:MAG: hypothetical protein KQJ78_15355 [Deltaproteobacteria bacterium]|nr:hypothetical protein [Deltaproteobacteria bacterium]